MKRFTKKLSNDKVALGKIYEHYVDSFDVDIIYGYQSERAKECGNRFYYGELIEKLAEYENLGTIEDFKNLIKEAQIMLKNNEKYKQSIKELSDSNSKFYKENEELKQQLAEQVKTVNIERIETFDNRKRWKSYDSRL